MRSRYSAFAQSNFDYLVATRKFNLESQAAQADERAALANAAKSIRWMNLLIVTIQKGKTQDRTGIVEFVAVYQPVSQAEPPMAIQLPPVKGVTKDLQQLHERAHFIKCSAKARGIKAAAQWLYTTGDILPPYQPQRNQPCWCGSRQRFGRCHGI